MRRVPILYNSCTNSASGLRVVRSGCSSAYPIARIDIGRTPSGAPITSATRVGSTTRSYISNWRTAVIGTGVFEFSSGARCCGDG